MAARLPGLLPPLSPAELLETSMVHSVAGLIARGELTRARPFRTPHHSATMAALTGGGVRIKPGEVSLAHNGVLFLDELPEFSGIMYQTHLRRTGRHRMWRRVSSEAVRFMPLRGATSETGGAGINPGARVSSWGVRWRPGASGRCCN
jgi:hypothetical protein